MNDGKTNYVQDTRLAVAGRDVLVRRSYQLAFDIEQRFGPLGRIHNEARAGLVPMSDAAAMLALMVKDNYGADGLDLDQVQAWVFEVGTIEASRQLLRVITTLFAGNENALEIFEGDNENPPRPETAAAT